MQILLNCLTYILKNIFPYASKNSLDEVFYSKQISICIVYVVFEIQFYVKFVIIYIN